MQQLYFFLGLKANFIDKKSQIMGYNLGRGDDLATYVAHDLEKAKI